MIYFLNLNKTNSNYPSGETGLTLGSSNMQAAMVVIAGRMKYKDFLKKTGQLWGPKWSVNGSGDIFLIWGKGSYTSDWTIKSPGVFGGPIRQSTPMDSYGKGTSSALVAAGVGLAAKMVVEKATKSWYAFVIAAKSEVTDCKDVFKDQRGAKKLGAYNPKSSFHLLPSLAPTASDFKGGMFEGADAIEVVDFLTSS